MAVSLSEERDRIQREVEKLEQSLSGQNTDLQLLSSDTDDESESDEKEDESTAGLLAQREKIQKEIENLENVLGPNSPVCVSGNDSSSSSSDDDSELGLSQSVESCLQMNLVYQQVLQETLGQLETLLTHNVKQQKELVSQLSGPVKVPPKQQTTSSSYQPPNTMYLGHFLKPYFKDKLTGLGPPANQETKEMASRMAGCLDENKVKIKRWESWQKTLIIHAVSRDSLKKLIQPKLSRVEYLTQKLSTAPETDKQQLREQIDTLEKEIDCLRKKKEEELIGERFEEHDWQKISNIDFEGTRDAEDICCFWQNFLHPSINKARWSQEEVQQLREISSRHGEKDWKTIAEELGTGRTAFMCLQTFQRFVSESLRRKAWSTAEDTQLKKLVYKMRIGNFIPYTQMSYFMEGRDPAQLIYRWNQVLDPSLKKGPWTKQEDQLLLQAVSRHGEKNWWKIRLEVPGRTDSACRDRYIDCLKAETKRGPFDEQERKLLLQLVEKYGVGRWAKIAAEIPNRYDAQCLRAWRKLSKELLPPAQKRRKSKNPPKSEGGVNNKKQTRRKPVKKMVEDSSEEEEEDMVVEYMDSDEEMKEHQGDENLEMIEEKEQEGEYTFPPIDEWIPIDKEEYLPFLSYRPVVLPSTCDSHSGVQVRSTTVGKFGLSEFIGPRPRELRWEERHISNSMMMLSPTQLKAYLSYELATSNKQRSCPKGKRQTGRKNRCSHIVDAEMCSQLQAAVIPWIGNLLIPSKTSLTAADTLREQGEKRKLSSTSVFVLLLQTMSVDTIGCKEMVEKRKKKMVLHTQPATPSSVRRRGPQTVAEIVEQQVALDEMDQQHKLILNQFDFLQLQKHQKPLLLNQKVQPQRLIMLQQRHPVPLLPPSIRPRNHPGFLQMSPGSCPQAVFIPHPILKPQQPCAATLQNIPSYFLNTSPLTLHRPPIHASSTPQQLTLRPVSMVSTLQNTTPTSSSSVLQQAVPLPQALIPNQTVSTGSTMVNQTNTTTFSSQSSQPSIPPNGSLNSPREQKEINNQQVVCCNDIDGTHAGVMKEARDLQQVTKTKAKPQRKAASSSQKKAKSHDRSSPPQPLDAPSIHPAAQTAPSSLDTPPVSPQRPASAEVISQASFSDQTEPGSLAPPPVRETAVNIPPMSVDLPLSSFHGEGSATQNLSSPQSTSLSTNQPIASSTSSFNAPLHCDHDYIFNPDSIPIHPSPTHKDTKPMHCKSGTAPSTLPKSHSRGRKRGRGEEQGSVSSILVDKNLGWTGDASSGADTCETRPGKRVRKPSQKVRDLLKLKADAMKNKTSCRTQHTAQSTVVKQQETQQPGLQLQPGQSKLVMTHEGLVQLAEGSPQGMQLALVQKVPILPSNPVKSLTNPLATPTLRFALNSQKPLAPLAASGPKIINYLNQPHTSNPLPQTLVIQRIPSCGLSCPSPPSSQFFLPYKGVVTGDPAEPPSVRREALQFDPSLMFQEPPEAVQDWLSGNKGVVVPGLGVALPYLPPFVSSLSTLTALLQAKKSLTESSRQLFPEPQYHKTKSRPGTGTEKSHSQLPPVQPDSTSDVIPAMNQPAPSLSSDHLQGEEGKEEEEQLVAAVRQLVTERFSSNPAYQMLKARFLSCFTLPALLATIQPMTFPEVEQKEDDVEEMDPIKINDMGRPRNLDLLRDESGAPAVHFSGITDTATLDQTRPDLEIKSPLSKKTRKTRENKRNNKK
ncbi:snRNA-activating protein complex subunit 4 isoform X2 [Solea solea]|nr:snRNA-activating protein complex subunit 4 isoform X2 [Solea solea]